MASSCTLARSSFRWAPYNKMSIFWVWVGRKCAPVEHCIKRRHLIHPHRRHLQQLRNVVHHTYARPSFVLSLAEVEEGDDSCLFVLRRVVRDNDFGFGKVFGGELEGKLSRRLVRDVLNLGMKLYTFGLLCGVSRCYKEMSFSS
jgi:hypothetical protein